MRHLIPALAITTLALAATASNATESGSRAPANPQYLQECGSCHAPFPPRLLGEAAWRQLMAGLDRHFGTDASLDAAARDAIERHLLANASKLERPTADGKPTLRISETAWFRREHDEIPPAVWQRASIKSAGNCGACHTQAEQGSFNERQIRIPK